MELSGDLDWTRRKTGYVMTIILPQTFTLSKLCVLRNLKQ